MKLSKLGNIPKIGMVILGTIAAGAGAVMLGRYSIKRTVNNIAQSLIDEPYDKNLMEFISAANRVGFQTIIENNMRATLGSPIMRPLGSPRKFNNNFDELMFNTSQLKTLPKGEDIAIDTSVVIGPNAKKPLKINIPIIVSGMAQGVALSEKVKIAIAKATALAGTATNTGQAGMLSSEREAAKYLILQFPRADWGRDTKILTKADMIEVQLGQGAYGGIGFKTPSSQINKKAQKVMGLKGSQDASIYAVLPEMEKGLSLKEVIGDLKKNSAGIPVGCKISAGKYLERDMELSVEAEVDYISIDGAQGGTHGSPPILQDDFGLPTLYALSRGSRFLQVNGLKGKISLIISGGLYTPGHFLKAIALGADAIYIGSSALFTVMHNQSFQAMPFEPPTQVAWSTGMFKDQFNIEKGAQSLYKYLISCTKEMEEGARALGKTSFKDINKQDLMALNTEISKITGVELAY